MALWRWGTQLADCAPPRLGAQAEKGFINGGINHVLLCTDGDFNLGVTNNDELVKLITEKRQSGVTLTALGFGASPNDAMMERVSDAGNGTYSVIYSEASANDYVKDRLLSSLDYIAKDMKIQVEFNPAKVKKSVSPRFSPLLTA